MDALTIHRPERETKDNRPPSDSIRDFRFARPKPPVSAPSEELPLMSLAIVSDSPPTVDLREQVYRRPPPRVFQSVRGGLAHEQ